MSFWDRYLAPGDLRARRAALAVPSPPRASQAADLPTTQQQLSSINPSATTAAAERIDPTRRQRRQNALFFGGLTFTLLSAVITRRALIHKRPPYPKQFTPSNEPPPKFEGSLDAAHALALATLNTLSVFMLGIGAGAMFFDIADLEDLREKVRHGVGFDVYGGETEADKELEQWVADVLSKKDGVGEMKASIIEKLYDMERKEQEKKAGQAGQGAR